MADESAKPGRAALPLVARLRIWHGYIGMLIAPTVLFMAATGILQVYSLHEAHADYTPPPIIEQLGRVHKDQVFSAPPRREHHEEHEQAGSPHDHAAPPQASQTAVLARAVLKAFLASVGILLITSTLIGIWMALRQTQRWRVHTALLILGAIVPATLIALTG